MTSPATPTPLPAAGRSRLGEGPVWDELNQRFYWVDIAAGSLHALDLGTDRTTRAPQSWSLGGACGFAVPTSSPGIWLAARGAEVVQLNLDTGDIRPLHALAPDASLRCNDGKCDPQGRLWVGTMPYAWGEFTGSFYRITPGHSPALQRDAVACSNGLAWSPDGQHFYYIDTLTRQVDRYHWHPESGTISAPIALASFGPDQGLPDGMCIDRDGHLWVAFHGGSCVRRLDGQTGAILQQIDLPVTQVTSCAFGGPDLTTLFITTASEGLDDAALAAQPLAGSVFTCQPGATGFPVDRYRLV